MRALWYVAAGLAWLGLNGALRHVHLDTLAAWHLVAILPAFAAVAVIEHRKAEREAGPKFPLHTGWSSGQEVRETLGVPRPTPYPRTPIEQQVRADLYGKDSAEVAAERDAHDRYARVIDAATIRFEAITAELSQHWDQVYFELGVRT